VFPDYVFQDLLERFIQAGGAPADSARNFTLCRKRDVRIFNFEKLSLGEENPPFLFWLQNFENFLDFPNKTR